MTREARDIIALYDAPDGELRRLWRGAGHVERSTYDSHVPDGRGGVLPIIELVVTLPRVDYREMWPDVFPASRIGPHWIAWIAWGETFVRIQRWEIDHCDECVRIHCTTGRPCASRRTRPATSSSCRRSGTATASPVPIALTEPSPPVPDADWMPQQRRDASDRLLAALGHACWPSNSHVSDTPEPRHALSP